MKKSKIIVICTLIVAFALTFSSCTIFDPKNFENAEIRKQTETMLDALIANDAKAAHPLVAHLFTEEDFSLVFQEMSPFFQAITTYELEILSINQNTSLQNGEKRSETTCVYQMTAPEQVTVIEVVVDGEKRMTNFSYAPYEQTDLYYTGTLGHMKGANAVQWALLLLNVVVLALAVYALVDCCRHKIKKKALWIVLITIGFVSLGATISSTGIRMNFNFGFFFAYSALVRYGSGTMMIRLMVPVAAILYFLLKRSLLKSDPAPVGEAALTVEEGSAASPEAETLLQEKISEEKTEEKTETKDSSEE